MQAAPFTQDEELRLAALRRYELLDTGAEQAYDDLTFLAKQLCDTPIALISLVDESRQWFKSKQGLDADETPRSLAFCAHAILDEHILEVPNALEDERFHDNPLVTGDPSIRFYAGAPLVTYDGFRLGTLCAISDRPKQLTDEQRKGLQALSRQVMYMFELRLHNIELRRADEGKRRLFSTISHDLRAPFNVIYGCAQRLHNRIHDMPKEQIADLSGRLLRTSERALKHLDVMVQWAQTQMNATTYTPVVLSLHALVDEVMATLDPELSGKPVLLENAVDKAVLVKADSAMLRSIMHNLISNGVKFTPAGGSVTVSAHQAGRAVQVSVADTGTGMDDKMLAKFVSEGALTSCPGTDNERGFGLGLILAREYLAYHSARLAVASTLGEGTQFRFTLDAAANNGQA